MRLPNNTPARIAFEYHIKDIKKPRARPQKTWLSMIKKCLQNIDWTLRKRY